MKEYKHADEMIKEAKNLFGIIYENNTHYYVGLCKEISAMLKSEENDTETAKKLIIEALEIYENYFKNTENKPVARARSKLA